MYRTIYRTIHRKGRQERPRRSTPSAERRLLQTSDAVAASNRASRHRSPNSCALMSQLSLAARGARAALLALWGALLPDPGALHAQQTASVHPTAPPVATSVRREGAVAVDGRLDETAWQRATPIAEFRQFRPTEGAPASLATEVRILYDDEALYVGARMRDSLGPAGIRAPLARRDQLLAADGNNGSFNSLTTDKFAVVLDPYHNHLDEVWFEVNPAGVRGDQFSGDPSWDPIWEAAAHVDAEGWTAEMRIPYSQLRFSRDSVQTW